MNAEQKNIIERIERLYASEFLAESELQELEQWLDEARNDEELELYLKENWEQAKQSDFVIKNENQPALSKRVKIWRFYKQIAAIFLLPIIGAMLFMISNQGESENQIMTVRTAMGDRSHFYLPDGTEVYLNAMSSLSYNLDYGIDDRQVEVTGEVFFSVQKNKSLPFVVTADSLKVEALGTQFLVRNYLDEPYVQSSLIEGKVKVQSNNEQVILLPGEGVDYTKANSELIKKDIDSSISLAWTKGQLVFKDDDMEQVCRKIAHWYGVSVVYNPQEFEGTTFSLRLRKEETLFNLLAVMGEVLQLNYRMVDDKIIINKQ